MTRSKGVVKHSSNFFRWPLQQGRRGSGADSTPPWPGQQHPAGLDMRASRVVRAARLAGRRATPSRRFRLSCAPACRAAAGLARCRAACGAQPRRVPCCRATLDCATRRGRSYGPRQQDRFPERRHRFALCPAHICRPAFPNRVQNTRNLSPFAVRRSPVARYVHHPRPGRLSQHRTQRTAECSAGRRSPGR